MQGVHQQQLYCLSETPGCCKRLWRLWPTLVPSGRELHASCQPRERCRCILTSITMRMIYAPSERNVCFTLRRGCSYAVAIYTTPGDVQALLRAIASYRTFTCGWFSVFVTYYNSLRLSYLACWCICYAINVFYMSEIYCPIFTLLSSMPSVLHILRWSIIGLQCFFLRIHIHIVAILALISVPITGSQVSPPHST